MSNRRTRGLKVGALIALIALGGMLGEAVSGTFRPVSAQWTQPCSEERCKKFLWIDYCGDSGGIPSWCDRKTPGADCLTRSCDPA